MAASISWNAMEDRELLECFYSLVETDSPSGEEAAVSALLREILKPLIGEGETDGAGNLKFFLPGTLPGPVRLYSAHMDTVEPGRGVLTPARALTA